jgi:hypothetical protein
MTDFFSGTLFAEFIVQEEQGAMMIANRLM